MFVKNSTTSTNHKFPTAISDDFFEQARGQWRANAWMEKCQSLITVFNFINRMRTILPMVCYQYLCIVFDYYLIDRFPEKTDYTTLRHIQRRNDL